jgi:hypothetical protein
MFPVGVRQAVSGGSVFLRQGLTGRAGASGKAKPAPAPLKPTCADTADEELTDPLLW